MSNETTRAVPLLSDSLYEKLCEARRYPGQMITHAWDARLQQWINAAMEQEAELQRLRGLLEEAREALELIGPADEHSGSVCEAISHGRDMLHEGHEPCPGIQRINAIIANLKK